MFAMLNLNNAPDGAWTGNLKLRQLAEPSRLRADAERWKDRLCFDTASITHDSTATFPAGSSSRLADLVQEFIRN